MDLEIKSSGSETIKNFKELFLKEFGLELIVVVSSVKSKYSKVDIKLLEDVTNAILERLYPGKYPEGIRKKSRERELVVLRQCFFKIATEMGYSLTNIGLYIDFNHATVIHGNRVITSLLDTMNSQVIFNYNLILNELKERSRPDADIQPDQHSEPNT